MNTDTNFGTDRNPATLNGQRDMLPKDRRRADNTFVPRGARRDSPGQPAGAIGGGHPDPAEVRATKPNMVTDAPEPVAASALHAATPARACQTDKPRDEREAEELSKHKSDHGSPPAPEYEKAEKPEEKKRDRGEATGKHDREKNKRTEIDTEDEIDETIEESIPASDPPSWSPGTV